MWIFLLTRLSASLSWQWTWQSASWISSASFDSVQGRTLQSHMPRSLLPAYLRLQLSGWPRFTTSSPVKTEY
ncbi:hypothetical protein BJX99DRAFT_228102 [Aspergillus californicus]